MIRTYDVILWTRIPNQPSYKLRTFRVQAGDQFAAINSAFALAKRNYITHPSSFFDVRHVPTLKTRVVDGLEHFVFTHLPAVWRYLKPAKSEIVSGDVTGLRLLLARLVGGVGPGAGRQS